jgi:ankyrin repeat protein
MPLEEGNVVSNISDQYGFSPLHVACQIGSAATAEALLKAGAYPDAVTMSPGLTPAHLAALYNHADCLQVLIDHGANIHHPMDSQDMYCTPVFLATMNKNADCVALLNKLESEADTLNTHWVDRKGVLNSVRPSEI